MPKKKAQLRLLTTVATLGALVLTGCSAGTGSGTPSTSPATDPITGGTFTWGLAAEPASYDPHTSGWRNAYTVIRSVFESLVVKLDDGTYGPWLAESWETSNEGRTYTLKLKQDVSFTDGAPLDAAAVVANFDRLTNPDTGSTIASRFTNIESYTALDDSTVQFTLKSADNIFLDTLASVHTGIISPTSLKLGASGEIELTTPDAAFSGTGPFTFGDFQAGSSLTLERNEDYSSPPTGSKHDGPAYVDEVVYRFLPEATVRTGALLSQQVDAIDDVQATDVSAFEGDPSATIIVGPATSGAFELTFNPTNPILSDIRVREAIRDGFDLEALIESQYLGNYDPAYGIIGTDSPYFDDELVGAWGNDIEGANALLDEAGWTERDSDGFRTQDGERLSIPVELPESGVREQRDQLLLALQADLRQNIGLDLDVQIISSAVWSDLTASNAWSIYPGSFAASDPAYLFQRYRGSQSSFFSKAPVEFSQPVDDLVAASLIETDPAVRTGQLLELQSLVTLDQVTNIPLYHSSAILAASSRVHDLGFDIYHDTVGTAYDVWLEE